MMILRLSLPNDIFFGPGIVMVQVEPKGTPEFGLIRSLEFCIYIRSVPSTAAHFKSKPVKGIAIQQLYNTMLHRWNLTGFSHALS